MFAVITIFALLFILGVVLIWFSSPRVRPFTAFVILEAVTAFIVYSIIREKLAVLVVFAATASVAIPLLIQGANRNNTSGNGESNQ